MITPIRPRKPLPPFGTWNVYELTQSGRKLLVEVTGADSHQTAKSFARDYMAEHGVRCCILKAA